MIPKPITYHLWKYPEEVPLLWENILFPIVRRVAAQVMNADLVAVQPMGEPNPILYAPIIYGYWEPKSIIDRIEKPKSYLEWKKYKKILKFWEENGISKALYTGNEPGYVWAPYIPIQIIEPIIEEAAPEFHPRRNIISRYAQKVVNNNLGTIYILNIK